MIHLRQAKGRPGRRACSRPPIPIPADVLHLLRGQMARTPETYLFVFTRAHNASRDFDATLRRAGIAKFDGAGQKLMLHSFRHSYATLTAGQVHNNPHFLKALLGHSRITTTDRYCPIEASVVPISDFNLSLMPRRKDPLTCATIEDVPCAQGE